MSSVFEQYRQQAGTPQITPQNPPQVIKPVVESSPELLKMMAAEGLKYKYKYTPSSLHDYAQVRGIQIKPRGFWENPQRIARFHDYIRAQPPDWKPPEWLDVPTIETAYKYLEYRNQGKEWHEWKYLPDDDPGTGWLRGLDTPPIDVLFPREVAEIERKRKEAEAYKIGSWENLAQGKPLFGIEGMPSWQQVAALLTPAPVVGQNAQDQIGRPTASKVAANIGTAIMQGYGAKAVMVAGGKILYMLGHTALASGIGAGAGLAAGGSVLLGGAAVGGLVLGLVALYQHSTGNKVPVLGDIIQIPSMLWNALDEPTEKAIGVVEQLVQEEDIEEILNNIGPAWEAGMLNWETNERNIIYNTLARLSGDIVPEKGEVWRIDLGMTAPQKLPSGVYQGVEGLRDVRQRLIQGEDPQAVYQEYMNAFGVGGYLNDMVMSTLVDPLNLAPTVSQLAMHKLGKRLGDSMMMHAWPKPTIGNAIVDAMPFPFNMLVPAVTKGKIQGSAGLVAGFEKYQIFIQTGFFPGVNIGENYKPPAEYSNLQKMLGGLDEDGLPLWFKPTEQGNFVKWLTNLTPESKAKLSRYNLIDHFVRALDAAGADPAEMTRIAKVLAQADPVLAGDALAAILNPPGEVPYQIDPRFFNSAIGTALAIGMRNLVESGKIDELFLAKWSGTEPARNKLNEISDIMEVSPRDLLARIKDDMDVATILKNKARDKGIEGFDEVTNKQLKDMFGVFVGKDALPWHPEQYKLKLVDMVGDGLDDFLIRRFDIKPDGLFTRFSHAMKNIQGLLVLGLNPQYYINNLINNTITRSATGIFGYMGAGEIADLVTRMRIDPARPDAGLSGEWSNAYREFGIDETGKADKISKIKQGDKDLLSSANELTGKVKDKVGIIGKLAGSLERAESRQAYTIALRQAYNQYWTPEAGFRKMPTQLEMALDAIDPNIRKRLYDGVKTAYNADEIDANVYKAGNPKVEPLIDALAETMASQHRNIIQDPSVYKQLLVDTGIADALNNGLAKAKNLTDVDKIFDQVINKSSKNVRKMLANDLEVRAETIKNRVDSGGIDEAVMIYTDMATTYYKEWVKHFIEIEELQNSAMFMTPKERNAAWRSQNALDDMRFEDLNSWENATWKGIFDALGKSNDVNTLEFLEIYKATQQNWRDFYAYRNREYGKVFDPEYKTDDWSADYQRISEKVALKAQEAQIIENTLQLRADELYATIIESAGGDGYSASITRSAVRIIRDEMMGMMNSFRQSLIDNPPDDKFERLARWNEFIQEEYIPKINELSRVQIAGAQNISNIPEPPPEARAWSELMHEQINPMLDALRDMYKQEFASGKRIAPDVLPEHLQDAVAEWLKGVKMDMPAVKLAAMKYAESARDYALLNYKKQTGFDIILSHYAPYQFWYTHTMANWAMRMIDRPALFAIYNRYQKLQDRVEKSNIPGRLQGRLRFPAPFLPEWMGGGLWIDPMKQIFPWTQFDDAVNIQSYMENSVRYAAYAALDELVKDGRITKEQADVAKQTQTGPEWEQAYAAALKQSDLSDPMTLASMMVQPAMYWSIPYNLLRGRPEKISPTPILRYSQGIQIALKDTPLDILGQAVGLMGAPERGLRETIMTPAKAAFGEWGDYYIDRQLANMVADGIVSIRDAKAAMIEREGPVYEQALERVKQEVAVRLPGIVPIMAGFNGANLPQVVSAIFMGLFPAGLLPTGELEYINKKADYSAAWERAKLGDKEALRKWFDENPEFEARIALRDEPDERLRQFLVSEIWDRYYQMPSRNRSEVNKQLGTDFQDNFLSKETRNYEALPIEVLAQWANLLGGYVPKVEQLAQVPSLDRALDLWPAEVADAYQEYQNQRDKLFPGYYVLQDRYYKLPYKQRRTFLKQFPQLKQYWDWKRDYARKNPIITPILAQNSLDARMESEMRGIIDVKSLDPVLVNQIEYAAYTGNNLGPGAWMALEYMWNKLGQPYGSLDKWVEQEVIGQYK